jgi:hypothetical protein
MLVNQLLIRCLKHNAAQILVQLYHVTCTYHSIQFLSQNRIKNWRYRVVQKKDVSFVKKQAKAAFSREIRLLGYGIIMVILQGLGTTFSFLMINYGFNTWYRPLSTATDFDCYIHPYFLHLLSTPLRNRCLAYARLGGSHVNPSQAPSKIKKFCGLRPQSQGGPLPVSGRVVHGQGVLYVPRLPV